jgi:hypothetical protein
VPGADYGAISRALGITTGSSGGSTQVDPDAASAKATADYYAAHPNLAMPASTKAYLSSGQAGTPGTPGAAAGVSSTAPGGAGAGPLSNTATPNPLIAKINEIQMNRATGDLGAGAETKAANINIRDQAENERKALRENLGARGVSGGGIEGLGESAISRATLQNQTKAGVDIQNDAERRRDALYGQVAGQEAAQEAIQRAQQNVAINQGELALAQSKAANQSVFDKLNLFKSLIDLSGAFA